MSRTLTRTGTPGIFRRENSYVVIIRDSHGKQFKRFAKTLAEAREIKAQLQAESYSGALDVDRRRVTFGEYAEEWLTTYAGRTSRGIRKVTLDGYSLRLNQSGIPFFGKMLLSEIEPRHIKRYLADLGQTGIANNTVRLHLCPVRALLATAVEDGLIRSNPAAGVRNVYGHRKADEIRTRALTDEQLRALLENVRPEYRFTIDFLAQTGLRIAEAAGLMWRDVDLEAGRIHVRQRLYDGEYDGPKSRFGRRTIPLTSKMIEQLERLRALEGSQPDWPVLASNAGTPLDRHNLLQRVLKPAAVKAGVPWATLHTLRHTCATRLFKNGWNAKQVQMMLGHHAASFTLDTYVHVLDDELPPPEFLAS